MLCIAHSEHSIVAYLLLCECWIFQLISATVCGLLPCGVWTVCVCVWKRVNELCFSNLLCHLYRGVVLFSKTVWRLLQLFISDAFMYFDSIFFVSSFVRSFILLPLLSRVNSCCCDIVTFTPMRRSLFIICIVLSRQYLCRSMIKSFSHLRFCRFCARNFSHEFFPFNKRSNN